VLASTCSKAGSMEKLQITKINDQQEKVQHIPDAPVYFNMLSTHLFNCPLSGTTQVSWYQKGKTNLDFTAARDSEWQ